MGGSIRYLYVPDDYLVGLTAAQLGLALKLMRRAAWAPRTVRIRGTAETVHLDRGEALYGQESLARDAHVSRGAVRKLVKRLVASGVAEVRPAGGHTEGQRRELGQGRPRGLRPTVIRFLLHRDFVWPQRTGADPGTDDGAEGAAEEAADGGAPYYPETTQVTQATHVPPPLSAEAGTVGARRKPGSKAAAGLSDPRHHELQARLEAAFVAEGRGAYGFQRGRDARAITELLQLSRGDLDEVERRWRMGLREGGFRRCDSIHELATKWNAYSAPGRGTPAPEPRDFTDPNQYQPVSLRGGRGKP